MGMHEGQRKRQCTMKQEQWLKLRSDLLDKCLLPPAERHEVTEVLDNIFRCLQWTRNKLRRDHSPSKNNTLKELHDSLADALVSTFIYAASDRLGVMVDPDTGKTVITTWNAPISKELQKLQEHLYEAKSNRSSK